MTKFGYCTSTSANENDPLGLNAINELVNNGYEYAELPLSSLMTLSNIDFENALHQINNSKIKCSVCNIFLPGHIKLTGPNVSISLIDEYLDNVIKRITKLDVEIVVFGSGGARKVEEGFDKEIAFKQLHDFLINVSNKFMPHHGIKIAIESLNKNETNILNSLTESATLAKTVNRDNVGLLIDLYHMDVEQEPLDVIIKLHNEGSDFIHAHIADAGTNRGFPLNENKFQGFAKTLKTIKYTGKLSIEGNTQDFESDIKKAKKILDGLFN